MNIRIDPDQALPALRPMGHCRFVTAGEFKLIVDGDEITIPMGFETDLGSIPRLFRPLLSVASAPVPFVVHDYLYAIGSKRDFADKLMFSLMKFFVTPKYGWQRRIAYWGVRSGGWVAYGKHRRRQRRREKRS